MKTYLLQECSAQLDLLMITDSSGSISDSDLEEVLQHMSDIVTSFTIFGEKGLKLGTFLFLIKYSKRSLQN